MSRMSRFLNFLFFNHTEEEHKIKINTTKALKPQFNIPHTMSTTMRSRQHLVLHHEHPLSLRLALQLSELKDLTNVLNYRVISPGLIELTLQAGDPKGYGSRSWPLRVGGAGLGDDDDFEYDPALAAMLGDVPSRAPVAVRFAVPIAMHGVDDAGFCDASFFESFEKPKRKGEVAMEPRLVDIAKVAISWLEGSHLMKNKNGAKGEDESKHERLCEQWEHGEQHMSKRMDVIREYAHTMTARGEASLLTHQPAMTRHILPEWIVPPLRLCFDENTPNTSLESCLLDWKSLVTEVGPGIYAFPLFTSEFCDLLIKEIDSFESTKLQCRRPNTMNRLGLVVNDIGFEPFMTEIVDTLIAPICEALYPDEIITCALDHHHSFVVRYRNEGDNDKDTDGSKEKDEDGNKGLDMHHDASEATLNVCLGRDNFTSGGLRFCGRFGDRNHRASSHIYSHTKGQAILHLGRHRHGADDIANGERINLIVWARNSTYRGAAAFGHVALDGSPRETETGEPDRLCLSKANDRDYEKQLKRIGSAGIKRHRTVF